jgi:hypothetical protein
MKLLYLYSKLWSKLSLKKLIFENKRGIEKKRMEEINEDKENKLKTNISKNSRSYILIRVVFDIW